MCRYFTWSGIGQGVKWWSPFRGEGFDDDEALGFAKGTAIWIVMEFFNGNLQPGVCCFIPGGLTELFFSHIELIGFVPGSQEAIVADTNKSVGEDVGSKPAKELHTVQGQLFVFSASLVIFVVKRDCAFIDVDEPVIGDGDLVGIPAQVFHDSFGRSKGAFGIDHPLG